MKKCPGSLGSSAPTLIAAIPQNLEEPTSLAPTTLETGPWAEVDQLAVKIAIHWIPGLPGFRPAVAVGGLEVLEEGDRHVGLSSYPLSLSEPGTSVKCI